MVKLKADISANRPIRWQDVEIDKTMDAVKIRQDMEAAFRIPQAAE